MNSPQNVVVLEAVRLLCEDSETDVAADLYSSITFDENQKLVLEMKNSVHPAQYTRADEFGVDYMLAKILSKWKGLRLTVNTKSAALRGWIAAERQCSETNKRIIDARASPSTGDYGSILFTARRKIASVLGPFDLATALEECRMGPGGTSDLSRRAGLDKKLSCPISVTPRAKVFVKLLIESDPAWFRYLIRNEVLGPFSLIDDSLFRVTPGEVCIVVDKDASTGRPISKQPTGNGFLQQGVGRLLRKKLKHLGIDLDDQSTNQGLASIGQYFALSTLDLKSASDSLSYELVYELLPVEWACYLDALRCPFTKVKGHWIKLNKFSAMGNAYTFELESLIFWALGSALAERDGGFQYTWVYGDDIICAEEHANGLIDLLSFCGFTVNEEKSFITGRFRESCGKHYFDGKDVTPIYLKDTDDSLPEIVRFANRLVRWSIRRYGVWKDQSIHRAWSELYHSVHASGRPLIPLGSVSDEGFLVPGDWIPSFCPSNGYFTRRLVWRGRIRSAKRGSLYSYKLRLPEYGNPDPKGLESVGTNLGKYTIVNGYVPMSQLTERKMSHDLSNLRPTGVLRWKNGKHQVDLRVLRCLLGIPNEDPGGDTFTQTDPLRLYAIQRKPGAGGFDKE